ncbi:hypothetical protein OG21DRAFT_1492004 [Imleria badia]|nr:hypothetical protein OG21DRAFT_1492004 [Imleria badia]
MHRVPRPLLVLAHTHRSLAGPTSTLCLSVALHSLLAHTVLRAKKPCRAFAHILTPAVYASPAPPYKPLLQSSFTDDW